MLAKNPIQKHYKGMPCMYGEAVARVVGESEKGSWANIDGELVFSIPLISTPHGTVIEAGRLHIDDITEEGLIKLEAYEAELKESGKEIYAGLI